MNQKQARSLFLPLVRIDGGVALKNFQKKNYKFAKVLKMTNPHASIATRTPPSQFPKRFYRVTRRMKLTFVLELQRSLAQCDAEDAQMLFRAFKTCPYINGLSLHLGLIRNKHLLQTYIRWFKVLKKLKSLDLFIARLQGIKSFFKALKRKKLQNLRMSISQRSDKGLENVLIFKNYPSTLKSLGISWKYPKGSLNDISPANLSLSHMRSLTSLHLEIPLPVGLHQYVIDSVAQPISMKSVALDPKKLFWNKNKNRAFFTRLLNPFLNLERLRLRLFRWFPISQTFIDQLKQSPLRKFELQCVPNKPINLVTLGRLAGSLPNLVTLNLAIKSKKIVGYEVDECFAKFFDYLSQLKLLKSFRVTIVSKEKKEAEPGQISLISHLARCIENYSQQLKFLSFQFYQTGHSNEWSQLMKVLKPKASALKTIEFNFSNIKFEEEAFRDFLSFLEESKSVKTLSLRRYGFHSAQQFEDLAACLIGMKSLNCLKFYKFNGELSKKAMVEFLTKLLTKPRFKKWSCTVSEGSGFSFTGDIELAEKLDLREVIKQNPSLQAVKIPYLIKSKIARIRYNAGEPL